MHEAAAVEILRRHAHLAMTAFLGRNLIAVRAHCDGSVRAERFAFQAAAAGIEFPYLIPRHALKCLMIFDIQRLHLHRIVITVLRERLERKNRHHRPRIKHEHLMQELSAEFFRHNTERHKKIRERPRHRAIQPIDLRVLLRRTV